MINLQSYFFVDDDDLVTAEDDDKTKEAKLKKSKAVKEAIKAANEY